MTLITLIVTLTVGGCFTSETSAPDPMLADFRSCGAWSGFSRTFNCVEQESLVLVEGRPTGWICMATEGIVEPERITIYRDPASSQVAVGFELPSDYPYDRGLLVGISGAFRFELPRGEFHATIPDAPERGEFMILFYHAEAEGAGDALRQARGAVIWTPNDLSLPPIYRLSTGVDQFYFLPATVEFDGVRGVMPHTRIDGTDFSVDLSYADRGWILMDYTLLQTPLCSLRDVESAPPATVPRGTLGARTIE